MEVIRMSETTHISIYPDNKAQKQRIESQAEKHEQSVSEYCLVAIEQRIAREAESERLDDLDLDSELGELKATILEDIQAATGIETRQEFCYEIALWELLGNDYSREKRRQAMSQAPDRLDDDLERLANKEGGDE
jgi:hypothetical protein